MLNAKKKKEVGGGKKFPVLDAGTYPMRVVQIIDFGVQKQNPYQGQEKPPIEEVSFTYEALDEFLVDEEGNEDRNRPRWVSESFAFHNLKAEKSKSTKRYYALDPLEEKEGDFTKLLNTPCMVTIVHKERLGDADHPYVNIASVSAMRPKEAAKAPPLVNKALFFDLDNPDLEVFNSFPDWIQDKIKSNLNYGGSILERKLAEAPEEPAEKAEDAPVRDKPKEEKKAAKAPKGEGELDDEIPW